MSKRTYTLITNPPYDKDAPVTYWIKESRKIFFNLFTRVRYIGDYEFDTGGCMAQMPFHNSNDANYRIYQLEQKE